MKYSYFKKCSTARPYTTDSIPIKKKDSPKGYPLDQKRRIAQRLSSFHHCLYNSAIEMPIKYSDSRLIWFRTTIAV